MRVRPRQGHNGPHTCGFEDASGHKRPQTWAFHATGHNRQECVIVFGQSAGDPFHLRPQVRGTKIYQKGRRAQVTSPVGQNAGLQTFRVCINGINCLTAASKQPPRGGKGMESTLLRVASAKGCFVLLCCNRHLSAARAEIFSKFVCQGMEAHVLHGMICFMFGSSEKSKLELSVDWSLKDETHSVKLRSAGVVGIAHLRCAEGLLRGVQVRSLVFELSLPAQPFVCEQSSRRESLQLDGQQ